MAVTLLTRSMRTVSFHEAAVYEARNLPGFALSPNQDSEEVELLSRRRPVPSPIEIPAPAAHLWNLTESEDSVGKQILPFPMYVLMCVVRCWYEDLRWAHCVRCMLISAEALEATVYVARTPLALSHLLLLHAAATATATATATAAATGAAGPHTSCSIGPSATVALLLLVSFHL